MADATLGEGDAPLQQLSNSLTARELTSVRFSGLSTAKTTQLLPVNCTIGWKGQEGCRQIIIYGLDLFLALGLMLRLLSFALD
jgi:hypothetical protein